MLSSLNVDGNTVSAESNYTFTNVVSNHTISATFTPISYTITYNLDGGTVSGNLTSYTIESETITLINPIKTGYTFAGWTGSNGNTPSMTVTIPTGSTENKEYKANWEVIISYTLTYDARGGSGTPESKTWQQGQSVTIATDTPTYSGYNFIGWYTGTGGSGTQYIQGTSYSLTSDLTLYAYWSCPGTGRTYNTPTCTYLSSCRSCEGAGSIGCYGMGSSATAANGDYYCDSCETRRGFAGYFQCDDCGMIQCYECWDTLHGTHTLECDACEGSGLYCNTHSLADSHYDCDFCDTTSYHTHSVCSHGYNTSHTR